MVSVNGEPARVGGVGGVVTVPEAQKKGFASQLMRHTPKFLEQQWEVDAGLLFCLPRLLADYEAFGWQEVETSVLIMQPRTKIVSPAHDGIAA